MSKRLETEKGKVTVRMYRQGLGDCFLLAFHGTDDKPRYMLIDFGVLQGTTDDTKKLKAVAKNIKEATGGHLHILSVSHEHWDHISGFVKAETIFEEITVDQVWLGWTEDLDNPMANELRAKKERHIKALKLAAKGMQEKNAAFSERLEGVLGFFGEGLGARARKGGEYIMNMLREKGREDAKYCRPGGRPLEIPQVEGIRVYVLGPPENEKMIKKSRPRKGEVYLTDGDSDLYDAFASEVLRRFEPENLAFHDEAEVGRKEPFDPRYRMTKDCCENQCINDFLNTHYYSEENKWRAIDEKWLEVAADMALKLDSHTNNTSLVLAIELTDSGNVLLFPGDAQVGNWLNWESLTWNVDEEEVTSRDLLERTVLYKVGHHGSHNATLREKGLELMTGGNLMALIPVEREMAKKKNWKMPYKPLYERLQTLCKERVIRCDDGVPKEKPQGISQKEWDSFLAQVTEEHKLYIDFTIS